MASKRQSDRRAAAALTASRLQVLLQSSSAYTSSSGVFRFGSPRARLRPANATSDSEWPLSSPSPSSDVSLRLPHRRLQLFETPSQARVNAHLFEDEPLQPSPVDESPPRRSGKRKRTVPQFLHCVWTAPKPCCSVAELGHVVRTGCGGTPSVKDYSPDCVMQIKRYFQTLSEHERRGFVWNRMRLELASGESPKRTFYLEAPALLENCVLCPLEVRVPLVGMRKVCTTFFKWCTGASNNLVYQPASGSDRFLVDRATRVPRARPTYAASEAWLSDMARYYQVSPDCDLVFLPMANKSAVWDLFKRDMKEKGKNPGCESYFMKTWRTSSRLQHIRIRKYLRFAKCDKCVEFRSRHVDNMDREKRIGLQEEEGEHHDFVQGERDSYYSRQAKAEMDPKLCMSVIIDGSDNSQYHMPYFRERSHKSQASWKLGLHVFGAISHGRKAYIYSVLDTVKLGSNATIEVLHRVLLDTLATEAQLPPKLFLQLDNTVRQCKNRYVMGYLAYLVHLGVFEEIVVSFLPVGHTHEDIDQIFGCISKYLAAHDAPSTVSFAEACRQAVKKCGKPPLVDRLDYVANFSEHVAPFVRELAGLTAFHQFRFAVVGTGESREVRLRVREWCKKPGSESQWRAIESNMLDTAIFKQDDEQTDEFLTHSPFFLEVPPAQRNEPKSEVQQNRLRTDIEALIKHRKIGAVDSADLRRALEEICSTRAYEFDWETLLYEDAFNAQNNQPAAEEKEWRDSELDSAVLFHPVNSYWIVRSDFSDDKGWEKKEEKDVDFFWVAKVVGSPVVIQRDGEDRHIDVPVRYMEVKELQARIQFNQFRGNKKEKKATITKVSYKTIYHHVKRYKMSAKGEQAVFEYDYDD